MCVGCGSLGVWWGGDMLVWWHGVVLGVCGGCISDRAGAGAGLAWLSFIRQVPSSGMKLYVIDVRLDN